MKNDRSSHSEADDEADDDGDDEEMQKIPTILMAKADEPSLAKSSPASKTSTAHNKSRTPQEVSNTRHESGAMSPNIVEIGSLQKMRRVPKVSDSHSLPRENSKLKHQAKTMRMATVSMSRRPRAMSGYFSYLGSYVEPRRMDKTVGWDEATSARPPLRIDMDGPTPCSYSPRNKPLKETNSPSWSFGRKTFVEKKGGSRTSWEKTWFQSSDVWHQKTDFVRERVWPSPPHYKHPPGLGPRQLTNMGFPAFSIGIRRELQLNKKGSDDDPAPNEYKPQRSDVILLPRHPAYTHGYRRGGTVLWPSTEGHNNPGPGAYEPDIRSSKQHKPAFTIRGVRRNKTNELGPFATF